MNNNTNMVESNKIDAEIVSYDVTAMNGKVTELTFYNTDLIRHTKSIQKYRDAGNMAILAIAHEFDALEKDESYKSAGFKTVADYGRIVFDYKPATVSLYMRSARAFLTEDENGDVQYKSHCPKFTVGQMIELLPIVKDGEDLTTVFRALQNGTINCQMSTKAIRDAVNSIRALPLKEKTHNEKTPLEKADKYGKFEGVDKLPKGVSVSEYANAQLVATIEAFRNYYDAMGQLSHSDLVSSKIDNVLHELAELKALEV